MKYELNYEIDPRPLKPQEGICTACGHQAEIEFVNDKWRWVDGTTHLKVNCPSCGEWRSLSRLLTAKTVRVPLTEGP